MTSHHHRRRSPALIPEPMSPEKDDRCKAVVRKFVTWTLANPRATKISSRQLAPDNREHGIGVSRRTLGTYFPERKCGDSTFHALCYMALDVYELYDPRDSAPPHIQFCAHTYRGWRRDDQARAGHASPTDPESMTDAELSAVIERDSDLTVITKAAKILTARLHRKLCTTSLFSASDESRRAALAAADKIADTADVVLPRVQTVSDRITDEIRRNCADIIDSAVDAHRLRSRDTHREARELSFILYLRTVDLDLTRNVRPEPEVQLCQYQLRTAQALMYTDPHRVIDKQLSATEAVVRALAPSKEEDGVEPWVEAWGEDSREVRARRPYRIDAEKLLTVVSHLASFLFAYPPGHALHTRAQSSADRLLTLYGPAAVLERHDVRTLFEAAAHPTLDVAKPVPSLRIVKFSGVGEVILARMLVRIATEDFSGSAVPPHIRLYLGAELSDEARRTLALMRAKGLYSRAISWLRTFGIANVVRDMAIEGRQEVDDYLRARPDLPAADSMKDVKARIAELRDKLNSTIVDAMLRADLNLWADVSAGGNRGEALTLIRALDESWRYLQKPELGLRTDLPPIVE